MPPSAKSSSASRRALLRAALAYPGAAEDHPWGEPVVKVDGKIFVFVTTGALTLKLPFSGDAALALPCASSTGHGLGKSGWVTLQWDATMPPQAVLLEWIDESYRVVAKRRRVAELDARM
jgi:predicted DNA-binding protein (MmcQ/YjbR family)